MHGSSIRRVGAHASSTGLELLPPRGFLHQIQSSRSSIRYIVHQSRSRCLQSIGCVRRPGTILQPGLGNSFNAKNGCVFRKSGIVWFRNDLRLHDHEALSRACAECTSILPVYCFDPREYGPVKTRKYGKTGPYRATFVIDAVRDLRERLRERGSDLIVVVGRPEEVVPALARKVGASAIFCHTEVTHEETRVENLVKQIFVEETGGMFHSFWTNTLHDVDDVPCGLEKLPQTFDEFRSTMEGIKPRSCVADNASLKGVPIGTFQVGEIPSLQDLGMAPLESVKGDDGSSFPSCHGGESEALHQMKRFVASIASRTNVATSFSGSIAPWLALGCLSPRKMMQTVLEESSEGDTEQGFKWIHFELLWRDFFRMLTRRYTDVVLPKSLVEI